MKVLLINSSGKEKGSTYTVLEYLSEELNKRGIETEIFWLGSSVDGGCRGCKACSKLGKCAFDKDSVNTLSEKAAECDGFIFGSPVHYAAASGNLTAALDRAFYSGGRNFAFKPAAAVAVLRRGGSSAALDQISKYFTINNMPIVPSTYWNMVHSSKPGDAVKDEEGMQTMRNLAQNMAWLLKSIEAGKKAGVEQPVAEKKVRTDFIR
ncbi:MAG: flavodoxin family protein [Ruminococcaceae bacterium]|nr:flavodoxin family protein [Oscillospiraceae bacterium]